MTTLNREQWLNEAANLILDEIIMPVAGNIARPPFRVSVGFPAGSRPNTKYKAIGQCFPRSMSSDGVNEIFIHPELGALESARILDILAHELIHAVDDCESGHKGYFAKLARAIGLEGKMTATIAGDKLAAHLEEFVSILGNIPHHAIDYTQTKKQKVRNLKVVCGSCDWSFRTSNKNIEAMTSSVCLACGDESLNIEGA